MVDCNDLPSIHWWTNKKKVLIADDGCRWLPQWTIGQQVRRGIWVWAPLPPFIKSHTDFHEDDELVTDVIESYKEDEKGVTDGYRSPFRSMDHEGEHLPMQANRRDDDGAD